MGSTSHLHTIIMHTTCVLASTLNLYNKQHANIVTGQEKRQIRPSQRYGNVDLVVHALIVVENTTIKEISIYLEITTSSKSAQWVIAMMPWMRRLRVFSSEPDLKIGEIAKGH